MALPPRDAHGEEDGARTEPSSPPAADVQRLLDDAVRPDLATGVVQCHGARGTEDPEVVHAAAARGISGGSEPLPFLSTIQPLFGHHDVTRLSAHQDEAARDGARQMGATAFATGDHVAFGAAPDLHTAAHEAAHVVQQRAGVHLKGGVGQADDAYERRADAVADLVVRGESAAALLDQMSGGGGAGAAGGVQRQIRVDAIDDGEPFDPEVDYIQASWGFTEEEKFVYREWLKDGRDHHYPTKDALKAAIRDAPRMNHDGKPYLVDRTLRQAADNVYQVHRGDETSVIKRAGAQRAAELGNEADLMERVRGHENVVGILDRQADNRQIRMEYVPNGMLRDFNVDSEPKAKQLARGIISGLAHVHAQGVIHGDLDNKNVFVGGTPAAPVAKIADFGSGQRGDAALLNNLAGDVCGGVTMLKALAQPIGSEQSAAFVASVTQVEQTAQQLNQDAMAAGAQQDPEALAAELGMTVEAYLAIAGPPQQVNPPTPLRVAALRLAWSNLATHPWLA